MTSPYPGSSLMSGEQSGGRWTPGPWKLNHRGDEVMVASGQNTGLTLAKVTQFVPASRAESDANARLISAAPMLLEALEAWHTYDSRDDSGPNAGVQMMIDYDHALTLTRAALALARSENGA